MDYKEIEKLKRQYIEETGRLLRYIFVFATTSCNSKCAMCNIWKKKKEYIPLESLKRLRDSEYFKEGLIYLSGGEFLLHPNASNILALFEDTNYILLTNGIDTKKIIDSVDTHNIKKIGISLDGGKDAYKRIRGVDAFDNVMSTLLELKRRGVEIHINYLISDKNSLDDFKWVKHFWEENGYYFSVQVEYPIKYLKTDAPKGYLEYDVISELKGTNTFLRAVNPYFKGKISLPCINISEVRNIFANGDLPLCNQKNDIVLGNINDSSIDDIMNSDKTKEIIARHVTCNLCWLNCQRIIDVKFITWLESKLGENKLKEMFPDIKWPYFGM